MLICVFFCFVCFCVKLWNSVYYMPCVAVVSARWGAECVRLRVVVKSDNCGEGQDCSGKGVCFSNISMVSAIWQASYRSPSAEHDRTLYEAVTETHGTATGWVILN
jgi:hypothetical protein